MNLLKIIDTMIEDKTKEKRYSYVYTKGNKAKGFENLAEKIIIKLINKEWN